jgi:hypothetical protein
MVFQSQRSPIEKGLKRKRFPWMLGIIVSLGLMAILAFVVVTLLILRSQGVTQGINTLTIISIVVGFVISILSLLISFLQWHHPQPTERSEPALHILPQTFILDQIERSRPSDSPTGPSQQHIESKADLLPSSVPRRHVDWGEAPRTEQFYGRERELAKLKEWLEDAQHWRELKPF